MGQAKRYKQLRKQAVGQGSQKYISQKRLANLLVVAVATALIVVSLLASFLTRGSGGPDTLKAAIVDQLSLTLPNQTFAQAAASLLTESGYEVDYYPGEEVTVGFYQDLPRQKYDLIIFRVHTAQMVGPDAASLTNKVGLFTSEPYTPYKHTGQIKERQLSIARYFVDSKERYFGIMPEFIRSSVKGSFEGALVILMGCNTLISPEMASSFVQKGASSVVGWDKLVSSSHTDRATQRLLENLIIEKLPLDRAVVKTTQEIGPDPEYDARLWVYPPPGNFLGREQQSPK